MISLKVASFGNKNKDNVSLTFDDGPNPHSTKKILDVLDFFNVKATFFVIGKRCVEYPNILKDTKMRGHLIGNHTFSHDNGDFRKCDEVIKNILGCVTDYVRPPFYDLSFCTEEDKYLQDKFIITGDVDSKDYLSISSSEVISNVLLNTSGGSIIDLHDGSDLDSDLKDRADKTIEALPKIITGLRNKGLSLVRIDEMDLEISKFHRPLQK